MTPEAARLRASIKRLERELETSKSGLARLERLCGHNWSEPKYTPVVTQGYRDPGDPPGTMGIDHRGPSYISRSERPKWTRTCPTCGKVETTEHTTEKTTTTKTPNFQGWP